MKQIPDRLASVRRRIRRAAEACGRDPERITLLAVSKTKPVSDVLAAYQAGQRDFGENYLQDALGKIAEIDRPGIRWHFIGRVQSNKTRDIATHFDWVHTIDDLRHAERLSRQRPADSPPLQVCLQVNLSGEQTKGGVTAERLGKLARAVVGLPQITLRGLMTMPDPSTDRATQQQVFAELYHLREALRAGGLDLDTLSMGMSGDLEAAIAEGATLVRIGTDIFGPRQ